jgi:hypothetical protein
VTKDLLKALQDSTGPLIQMLGAFFYTAAVADSLHVFLGMNQNRRRDNNRSIHNNLENLLPTTMNSDPGGQVVQQAD